MKENVKKFIKEYEKVVAVVTIGVIAVRSIYIFSGTEAGCKVKSELVDKLCDSIVKRNREYFLICKYKRPATEELRKAFLDAIDEL